MKKSELKQLIKECIHDVINESMGSFVEDLKNELNKNIGIERKTYRSEEQKYPVIFQIKSNPIRRRWKRGDNSEYYDPKYKLYLDSEAINIYKEQSRKRVGKNIIDTVGSGFYTLIDSDTRSIIDLDDDRFSRKSLINNAWDFLKHRGKIMTTSHQFTSQPSVETVKLGDYYVTNSGLGSFDIFTSNKFKGIQRIIPTL